MVARPSYQISALDRVFGLNIKFIKYVKVIESLRDHFESRFKWYQTKYYSVIIRRVVMVKKSLSLKRSGLEKNVPFSLISLSFCFSELN